jgi:DNA/RNA-binding protein KIN17
LTFGFYLGLCEIEQTEKGWYITLIDKDPDSVRREMDTEKKEKMDLDDEQRRQKLIAEQVCFLQQRKSFFFHKFYLD